MNREIKYQVYFDKEVPYIGGKMWAVVGMSWREYIDDGEPENPIRHKICDLDIASVEDFEKEAHTKTSWQGDYIKGKFHLRQYTSLKDKNGKEIYEGDIVKHFGSNGVIDFRDGSFHLDWGAGIYLSSIVLTDGLKAIEVIGNIYENPELLERKK